MSCVSIFDKLERLISERLPDSSSEKHMGRAALFFDEDKIDTKRWGVINLRVDNLWTHDDRRSLSRYEHAFLFVHDLPTYISKSPNSRALAERVLNLTKTWQAKFPYPGDHDRSMAYADETTAQRLRVHLQLLHVGSGWFAQQDIEWLQCFIDRTAELLVRDDFHAGLNNHGMFQDIALVEYAALASWQLLEVRQRALECGIARLHDYFAFCFTDEGVHVENTPTYHTMVSKAVAQHTEVLECLDHPEYERYTETLQKLARYATHALMPNGAFPPISDTTSQRLEPLIDLYQSDEFTYAATLGTSGQRPSTRTLVLPQSGYAIYRSAWGDVDATYLFFQCASNANYHKHADENSFVLRSRGVDLITEAGPHGYDYANPFTKHGFSQFAHNTVVLDNVSLPRTVGEPGAVRMEALRVSDSEFTVLGRNGRLVDAVHERTIDVTEDGPHPDISIVDVVKSATVREASILWHLGLEVKPVLHGHGFELFHGAEKVCDVHFTSDVPIKLDIVRGQTRRPHLGWVFPAFGEKEAADVVRLRFRARSAQIRTSIRLHDFTYTGRGLLGGKDSWRRWHDEETGIGLNYVLDRARDDRGKKALVAAFSAIGQPGDFTYNYRSTIQKAGAHGLYILDDFGDQGSYYLKDHQDDSIFRAVQNLVRATLATLRLTGEDLITVGSSKGGTAALLHGLGAGARRIFVGAPQTRIGSFVRTPHPNILRFMTGDTDDRAVSNLDGELYRLAREEIQYRGSLGENSTPHITLVVGDADHHYHGHVQPFVDELEALETKPGLTVLPGLKHADIGVPYRHLLLDYINQVLDDKESGVQGASLVVSAMATPGEVTGIILSTGAKEYAGRLYRGSDLIGTTPYSTSRLLRWTNLEPGRYRVRIFARSGSDDQPVARTTGKVTVE